MAILMNFLYTNLTLDCMFYLVLFFIFFHLTVCIAKMDDRYTIATGKSYNYILQFAISLGQLYGVAVYYITAILEGDNFSANWSI